MASQTESRLPKTLSWNALSFRVPGNWELALYKFLKRGIAHVEVEDEYSVRLEADWVRPKRKLDVDEALRRYEARTSKVFARADSHEAMAGLPEGWTAHRLRFSQTVPRERRSGLQVVKQEMVTALYLCRRTGLVAFFILHFAQEDAEDPAATLRLLAEGVHDHTGEPLLPWRLFDLDFALPPDFLLENTLFDVGAKLMIFRWKRRRLFLWHFSCASMFLKDTSPQALAAWLAAYFNDVRLLRGGHFYLTGDHRIAWRRRRRHVFAHRDQLARWCFQYTSRFHLDPSRNMLIAWVFNHRRPDDIQAIPEPLRFD